MLKLINDWLADHIKGIFAQWVAVTMIEIPNAIGFWDSLVSAYMRWTVAEQVINYVWFFDCIFVAYSWLVYMFRRVRFY